MARCLTAFFKKCYLLGLNVINHGGVHDFTVTIDGNQTQVSTKKDKWTSEFNGAIQFLFFTGGSHKETCSPSRLS